MTSPTDDLGGLCREYRCMQTMQQQLAVRAACCARHAAYSPLMCERLAQLHCQQQELLATQRATAAAIHSHTATLPDERLRTIVELRYLGGMSWSQVSELMGLELRWLMRLHKKAINT